MLPTSRARLCAFFISAIASALFVAGTTAADVTPAAAGALLFGCPGSGMVMSTGVIGLVQYLGYLRRNPDAAPDLNFAGFNFWLNKLNQFNGNYVAAEMLKAFIASNEYRRRFGQ